MIWSLALQSLRLRPLRTFLTALGIAVAVGSTIIFLSLGEGLRQVFTQEIGGVGPAIQVSYGPFDATALTAVPELPLRFAAALRAADEQYGVRSVTPIMLYARGGFTPGSAFLFQGLPTNLDVADLYFGYEVVRGRGLGAGDRGESVAVIGESVAERNNVGVGSTLRLNPEASLEVVGVARSGGGLVDNAVLLPLATLQRATGIRDRVSFFALDLVEPARAAEIAESLSAEFPQLGFQTQEQVLQVLERGVRISDVVRLGISAIALIVGAISVTNTVLMSVFERTREFGVIRAVGAKPRFLFGLVLTESVVLSLVGAAFGVLLGRLGIGVVNRIADGLIGTPVAALTLRLAVFAVAVAFLMGIFAGLIPAARAARIQVAVAMSRE